MRANDCTLLVVLSSFTFFSHTTNSPLCQLAKMLISAWFVYYTLFFVFCVVFLLNLRFTLFLVSLIKNKNAFASCTLSFSLYRFLFLLSRSHLQTARPPSSLSSSLRAVASHCWCLLFSSSSFTLPLNILLLLSLCSTDSWTFLIYYHFSSLSFIFATYLVHSRMCSFSSRFRASAIKLPPPPQLLVVVVMVIGPLSV